MRQRARLLIRALNTRAPGAALRDQFAGTDGGPCWLTRAQIEAALALEPGSARSDRLLSVCFPPDGAGVVAREAFLAFLELGTPLSPSSPPPPSTLALVPTRMPAPPPRPTTATSDSGASDDQPRRVLLLPDSTNEEHLLRRRPHWRKREVVVEERVVEYTTVNEEGGAQSLVERERTVTEVLHWEAPLTEEAAHRETIAYEQREAFDGVQTSASSGEEEYVHMHNVEHQEFESLRSSLPERYYAGREPPPSSSSQHRRQSSFQPHAEEEVQGVSGGWGRS